MKKRSNKYNSENIVITLDTQSCRIQHLSLSAHSIVQLEFHTFDYTDLAELNSHFETWSKQYSCKGINCRWILTREIYQTYPVDAPKVPAKELDNAIKWQIKDLLELPVNEVLLSHYLPSQPGNQNVQLVAVATSKALIEQLIEISRHCAMQLDSIEVEELVTGHAVLPHLVENKIVGLIDEDRHGLIFNFYSGDQLSFSRHKKGNFLPLAADDNFSLEGDRDSLEEAFLLETQRTLDYVVSQIFRRPIDYLLLRQSSLEDRYLADLLKQLTELEVIIVTPLIDQRNPQFLMPSLVETGAALRQGG